LDTPGKRFNANYSAHMQAARDNFHPVARFDLERDLAPFGGDHARSASHALAERRRPEMPKLNFSANRPFIRIEKWSKQFARGAFKLADQNWRAEDGWHAVGREIDHVLLLDNEFGFMGGADSGKGPHVGNSL